MARRPWSKFWDADYLADDKLNQLSFRARGIVHVLWAFSRTQTDEVGVLTVGGKSLTSAQYVDLMCRVSAVDVRTRRDYIWSWVCEALSSGCFEQREDGAWYSPRIVREAQESEKLSTYGRKGAAKTNRRFARYNRGEPAATPAAKAAAEAAGRSEAEADAEENHPRAHAFTADQPSSNQDTPEEDDDRDSSVSGIAIAGIESITGTTLIDTDRRRITAAASGKDRRQIEAALERIQSAYESGTVRSIVGYAARAISDTPPAPRDRSDDAYISAVQNVCRTLNLDYGRHHIQILQAVKRNPGLVTKAAHATWEDAQAKIVSWESPRAVLDRFLERMESGAVGSAT